MKFQSTRTCFGGDIGKQRHICFKCTFPTIRKSELKLSPSLCTSTACLKFTTLFTFGPISSKILFYKLREILRNEIKLHDSGSEGNDEIHLYAFTVTYLDPLKNPDFPPLKIKRNVYSLKKLHSICIYSYYKTLAIFPRFTKHPVASLTPSRSYLPLPHPYISPSPW